MFKTDGSTATLVEDINAGAADSSPSEFTVLGDLLVFSAMDVATGVELYSYDGSAVTLYDINSGTNDSSPVSLTAAMNTLFFRADDGSTGEEFWSFCLPIDNTTTGPGATITANGSGFEYQWLDCNNGNAPIAGETSQDFTPTVNGSYAVILKSFSCVDTSSCVTIANVGIDEQEADAFKVYPNPASDQLFIESERSVEKVSFTAMNGQELNTVPNGDNSISLASLTPGMYIVNIYTENDVYRKRVVIK